ncbi:MAG: hypothetical protein K9I69_01270 [Ignavibacteriales bacterium]|nr:hypothetical protein [Ignavibacteriales bacterium]MCF8305554.1 hypothetical protein [Ignavibacteriales bacterium]MCF8315276.1 hypothetical protein [Ignavibacteriales bacterium]MCF8436832.1 hypothetical protein [Ignavibacteriales bacterium]
MKQLQQFFLVIFITVLSLQAQGVSVNLLAASPQGEFRKNVDRLGYGIQLDATFFSPDKVRPVAFGININYLVYGEENESRPLSLTIPDVRVDVSRKNSMLNFQLLTRLSPFSGTVRPYLDVFGGGAYIYTSTSVDSEVDDRDVFESNNFDDFAWTYGYGAGLLFRVAENLGDVRRLFVDLRVRSNYSSEAEYLKEGAVIINSANGNVSYNVSTSKLDYLSFHIGVYAALN